MPFVQDLDAKLTLTRAASAPALIAEIAQQTKLKLEVSPTLSNEVLLVSVQDGRVGDVLARIATAATATWQPMEGGYRLVADRAERNIQAQTERARKLQLVQDQVRKAMKAKADAAKAKAQRQNGQSPANGKTDDIEEGIAEFMGTSTVDEFLPMVDLAALAGMEEGDRIVFSTMPTGMQRPLKGNVVPIVAKWVNDHNQTAKTMAGSMDEMPEETKAFMSGPIGDRIKRMSRPIQGSPAKLLLVASRGSMPFLGEMGLDVRLELRAYGRDGKLMLEESGSLDTSLLARFAELATKKPTAQNATRETLIEYSPLAKEYLGLRNLDVAGGAMSGAMSNGLKFSPELRERLFSPDKYEPLGLIPGEALVALANARRKPLVASLPDSSAPGLFSNTAPKSIEEMERSLGGDGALKVVPDATFLVVRASEPEAARRMRVDRGALAGLLKAVVDHEVPTLDELASFATRAPEPTSNPVELGSLMFFAPGVFGSMSGLVSWDALRLYGSLGPTQRTVLETGGRLPIGSLSSTGLEALRRMIYGANATLVPEGSESGATDMITMAMQMAMGGGGGDLREEPTEAAPRGLPANGYLVAAVSNDPLLRPITASGSSFYSLGTDELAMFKMFSSSPIAEQAGDAFKLPETARLGTRKMWNIRAYVAPGLFATTALQDDSVPKNAQVVSLNSLPANIQAKVDEKTAKLKKSPLGAIATMGGMRRPPVNP